MKPQPLRAGRLCANAISENAWAISYCFIAVLLVAVVVGALTFAGRAIADERNFGAVQPSTRTTSHADQSLKSAEMLSRNYGAVQNSQPFRNANGDFSYLSLYSSYEGYGGGIPWGGWGLYGWGGFSGWRGYGWGGYGPWGYGYPYSYPYRYYPYAYGYPYGFSYFGPTAYYGGWYGGGFPYSAAYYGPWWSGFGGGTAWYGGGSYARYAGCYYW